MILMRQLGIYPIKLRRKTPIYRIELNKMPSEITLSFEILHNEEPVVWRSVKRSLTHRIQDKKLPVEEGRML